MSEADKPKNLIIIGTVGATIALFLVILIGVNIFFDFQVRDEIQRKQLAPDSTVKRALRADEEIKLTHYTWADQKGGVVRIPLERAMELTLKDGYHPPVPPPVVPAAAAVPGGVPDGGVPAPGPAVTPPAVAPGTTAPAPGSGNPAGTTAPATARPNPAPLLPPPSHSPGAAQ